MITIIKRGTKQIAKCETCGCEFYFEAEDINNRPGLKPSVRCPQCTTLVILKNEATVKG